MRPTNHGLLVAEQKSSMLKSLFFLIIVSFSLSSQGEEIIPSFQCKILKKGFLDTIYEPVCSGTLLNGQKLASAAHCFDIIDVGIIPQKYQRYRVQCPNGKSTDIKGVVIHPEYYVRENHPIYEVPGNLPWEFNFPRIPSRSYNDVAIAHLKNDIGSATYALLPSRNHVDSSYQKCRMLGYSTIMLQEGRVETCNLVSDNLGCYRNFFSLFPPENIVKSNSWGDCNYTDGSGCRLSSYHKDFSFENSPIMFSVKDFEKSYSKGDSGGGFLCKKDGKEYFTAIATQLNNWSAVNVWNKLDFIRFFIDLDEQSFATSSIQYPMGVPVDLELMRVLRSKAYIESYLKYLKQYHHPNMLLTSLNRMGSEFGGVLLALESIIRSKQDNLTASLLCLNIGSLDFSDQNHDGSSIENTVEIKMSRGLSHITIGSNVSVSELKEKLNCKK